MHDFVSSEEKYFFWYLQELINNGYVDDYVFQPESQVVIPRATYSFEKQMKTKTKLVEKTLLQQIEYQPDYLLKWSKSAEGIFFTTDSTKDPFSFPFYVAKRKDKIISILDIKGTFNQNNMHRIFSIQQKLIYHLYNIYVQKVITAPSVSKTGKVTPANALFTSTFMPYRYLSTDISGNARKIRFPFKLMSEFVSSKKP